MSSTFDDGGSAPKPPRNEGSLDTASATKDALRKTIRDLRERLLADLHAATEGEYQLAVPPAKARLSEAQAVRRRRLDAWLDEQVRGVPPKDQKDARDRFRAQAEKEAAYTLLHRLVVVRALEGLGLVRPAVIAGCARDWRDGQALRELAEHAPELCGDETEGFRFLLGIVFGELALDLPGLFGDVGLTSLIPIPTPTLKAVVEALASPDLDAAWTDDTTLGWVYQYWNDPDREALDAKIARREKIAPHEIASKTQMFTERYMVEWLLQNSLGLAWLAICKKHGWTPDAARVLGDLETRRADWRKRREAGEVALDALMPVHGELEGHWKYHVQQPIPDEVVASAPDSIRTLKLLDPACGSGHFLVIAFDQLAALYREEARHRGEEGKADWSEAAIVRSILENNLFGIDIDPRAVQIAAAALYLKARSRDKDVQLRQLHLVAPVFRLAKLPKDDPAVVSLRADLLAQAGVPWELTDSLLASLAGVDHLGSLLRVGTEIETALRAAEQKLAAGGQGNLYTGFAPKGDKVGFEEARATVLDRLEEFLAAHTSAEDLGLRLDGEQLAAGVRFVRMAREGAYDIVVGNPPYQGLSKTESFGYVSTTYPRGKADLYAAFLERGLQLVRPGGLSALLTMRGWMFLGQFTELRRYLLHEADLRLLGDVDRGAFEAVPDEVLATVMSVVRRGGPTGEAIGIQPTPPEDRSRDSARTARKRAALLAQVGRHGFDPRSFAVIDGEPIVYWWTKDFLREYADAPKLGEVARVRQGVASGDDVRFVRRHYELAPSTVEAIRVDAPNSPTRNAWVPFIKGATGKRWFEDLDDVIDWRADGMKIGLSPRSRYGRAAEHYFSPGIAFSMIGTQFSARAHTYKSVIGHMGSSVFPPAERRTAVLCGLNSGLAAGIASSLNPGVHFEVGDVNRLPLFVDPCATEIAAAVAAAFLAHEAAREPSAEFRAPGPSPWAPLQAWAQRSLDRPPGSPLQTADETIDPPAPGSFVSFAVGVALGRFGPSGEGILDHAPPTALPAGILFLSAAATDSLDHPACAPLHAAWAEHGGAVGEGAELRDYLARSFFAYHKGLYENRPIYFPLSSSKKSFVAWVSIHRWTDTTLDTLLADHLLVTRKAIVGELADLRDARAGADKKRAREAERRHAQLAKWLEELDDFIALVTECAEKGAPPVDPKHPREVDAPFRMDLDDGVMINSAALWPLLEPQWKDPKKWWKELSSAPPAGATVKAKDYDWAHLAKRYWPARVDEKCKLDPSLGVAHGCFWKYHPAKAYAWELRLQHELEDPGFRIEEAGSDAARAAFLADHATDARGIEEKEQKRRARKSGGEEDDAQTAIELGEDGEEAEGDA